MDPRAEEGVDGDDDLLENGHAWLLSLDVSGLPVSISVESGQTVTQATGNELHAL